MPKIEHNAPGLRYRVYWKQDIPGQVWNSEEITDYTTKELKIDNQPTYQRYKVKVVASNEKGESNVLQNEVIGYSGEDGKLKIIVNCYYFSCNYQFLQFLSRLLKI